MNLAKRLKIDTLQFLAMVELSKMFNCLVESSANRLYVFLRDILTKDELRCLFELESRVCGKFVHHRVSYPSFAKDFVSEGRQFFKKLDKLLNICIYFADNPMLRPAYATYSMNNDIQKARELLLKN